MIKNKEGKVLSHGKRIGHAFKSRTKTLALGYVRLEDRLAQIQLAGLNTLMAADRKQLLYDGIDEDSLPPPLPRHFEPDIADVSELYRAYRSHRIEIVQAAKEKMLEKQALAAKQQAANPPSGAPGSGGGVSAPVGADAPKQ